ncbi:hypothetical protein AB0C65_35560 [Nocardia sp. NPDC048505]|uniref:hypothetical protein n=1 Tax=Nocardia sp. NPDC048505 TaxID=3155756 RepID=UPI0033F9782A
MYTRDSPLSVDGLQATSRLEVKPIRKAVASLTSAGLITPLATGPEPMWALTDRARRWLETSLGRAALDVPPITPAAGETDLRI